ncbi:MAG TPA: hypothetical protein DG754_14845 [Bacteroidales bacterium]|nr:hypothetical protein [Bacteroidales bacterium]
MSRVNNTKFMESLNDCKFQQLTSDEMKFIEGGGWRVDVAEVYTYADGTIQTYNIMRRYTIFGNPTDDYCVNIDYC